jgi:hypothetical protein
MEQTMPTNRAFLLACATVAAVSLSAASSTPADAKPCHTDDSTPRQERSCLIRSTIRTIMTETAEQAAMAKQAAMEKQAAIQAAKAKQAAAKQAAAKQAAMQEQAAAKQSVMAKEAASNTTTLNSPAPADKPPSEAAEPATQPRAANPCLTKDYLDNGAVIFRDTCTGEWAERPTGRRAQQ